jgi:hypothetical protein
MNYPFIIINFVNVFSLLVEPLLPAVPGALAIPGLAPPYQNNTFLFTQNSR